MTFPTFDIVSAVTPSHVKSLAWSLPSWGMKPQFADKKLYLFISGFKDPLKDLEWVGNLWPDVELVQFSMEVKVPKRELMLSSYILGAAKHVQQEWFVKLDADAYFVNSDPVFSEEHLEHDLVAAPWGYTKPACWLEKMSLWLKGQPVPGGLDKKVYNPGKKDPKIGERRIISYCCLHKTESVCQWADLAGSRLPVPSHDTFAWFMADRVKEYSWGTVDVKSRGVRHSHRDRKAREEVCESPHVWSSRPMLVKALDHVQLELVSYCNLACPNCDRGCSVARTGEHMSLEQVEKFVDESLSCGHRWKRIDLIGGEPTLHPELPAVVTAVGRYKEEFPDCKVRLTSNGSGPVVKAMLSQVPDWVSVRNSSKEHAVTGDKFDAVHMAPKDEKDYKEPVPCSIPWRCGIALSPHGFYLCGAGASIGRILGMEGVLDLQSLLDNLQALTSMGHVLCEWCGHSPVGRKSCDGSEDLLSESWKEAIQAYNARAPKLPLY